jgi:hypothetical protein
MRRRDLQVDTFGACKVMKTVAAILTTSIHPVRLNCDIELRPHISMVAFEMVLDSVLCRCCVLVDIESRSVSEHAEIAFLDDSDVSNVNDIG